MKCEECQKLISRAEHEADYRVYAPIGMTTTVKLCAACADEEDARIVDENEKCGWCGKAGPCRCDGDE